ncbi:MAG: hypothetical protein KDA79_05715, partial [Planctomycetaceae bacterium]|nr:hypothetical protein [Planctomycetaceae bacterium]
TDMLIPRPFTTVFARGGTPLPIPPKLDREGIELWRRVLEQEMNRLEAEVEVLCGREPQLPVDVDVPAETSAGAENIAPEDSRQAA